MITVKYKPNRFENEGIKIRSLKYDRSRTIKDYIVKARFKESKKDLLNYDVIVNGKLEENLQKIILERSSFEIIFTSKILDEQWEERATPDFMKTDAWRIISTHPSGALDWPNELKSGPAGAVIGGVIGFIAGGPAGALKGATYGYGIGNTAEARHIGVIELPTIPSFDSINQAGLPSYSFGASSLGSARSLEQGSPTYGWDGMQTTQDVGGPIPVIYGTHKTAGNIINQFVTQNGDKAYLNLLLGLCEGEIEDISTITINDQPIANFSDAITYERYGTNDQAVTPNFEDLHTVYSKNNLISADSEIIYTTIAEDIDAFEINFKMPGGLYRINPITGENETRNISLSVGYRLTSVGGAYTSVPVDVVKKQRSVVRFVHRQDGLTPGQYDIKIRNGNLPPDQYTQDGLIISSLDEIIDVPLKYPNTATLGLKVIAQDQLSGGTPNVTCIAKGMKISVPNILNGATPVSWDDYYWNSINSEYRLITGDTSLTWDGATFVTAYSANPIWCLKDLITNNRYGLGDHIGSAQIDDSIYLEMAQYCDELVADGESGFEKRFRLDIIMDSFTRALDLLVQLSSIFRAYAFYSNNTVLFKIDKPEITSQVFAMGNIMENTFSQSWKSIKETPNIIEVTYMDAAKDYKQETVEVRNEASIETNGEIRITKKIRVFVTKLSYAIREARYVLNHAKYINRSISLETEWDGLSCQCIDRIDVSHDVPQWGASGKILDKIIIIPGVNDKLDWTEDASTYAATLREGRYTPANLAIEVQYQMRKAADDNTTVAWVANKITIANATLSTMTLLWSSGTNTLLTCGDALGYDIGADDTGSLSYLADNIITEANTTTEIKFDRALTIVGGSTYKVLVRLAGNDSVQEKTVSTGAGVWTKLQFAGDAFSAAPEYFDNYAFGVSGSVTKPYRVMGITRAEAGMVSIHAIEYNESVIDDTAPVIPTSNYSALTLTIPDVTDLVLTEGLQKKHDGTIIDIIEVWFNKPIVTDYQLKKYAKARIYYKESGATSYIFAGETTEEYFAIKTGLNDLTTYEVVVVSIDDKGQENSISDSVSNTIYLFGKSVPPLDVTGFVAIQDGDGVRFSWQANADVDLFGYEIREQNVDWDNGSAIETEIQGTDYFLQMPAFGTKTYLIKAIDTSGNYSLNATSSSVQVDDTPNIEEIGDFDLDDWENGTIEIGSETADVVNIAGTNIDTIALDNVIVSLKGFETKSTVEDSLVKNSLGGQVVDSGNNRVIQSATLNEFLELRNLEDGVYATEGIYISPVQDTGQKIRQRINIIYNIEGLDTYQKIEIDTSDDGITWNGYTVWGFGEYVTRYFRIKFTLGTNDNMKVARLRYLKARISALYYNEVFEDETYDGITPTTVTFVHDYWKKLIVRVQEQGDYYADITKTYNAGGVSTLSFVLKDNATNNVIAGTADVEARGY